MRIIALALLVTAPAAAAPPRIVSINPCVDAILMHVADPGQIAGISHYSKDPRASSITASEAARYAATSGTAEEVVALAPDLVIAGAHVAPATIAALKRMDIALLQLGVPETISESREQVRQIAAAVGHPDRGARLNARIDAAVAAAGGPAGRVPALIWQGGGLVPGEKTLASELLRRTGFHNLSKDYGLKNWDVLPLEYLIARAPRVLFSVGDERGEDRMLGHPALRRMGGHIAIRPYPERLLRCGGPTIIDAVAALADARRSL
ncbi:ABC transporter substrate-binding protein [Polymorphobacter fuscus]|uniref:ABC transporter substrate-binding protein n=1 Tax=Sandarakinorhabdus fusca TaxID=1439888 RepID=A0A7C9KVA5_9SPHN|nr:ABC transporter substrate-binding protein [Polymorphobacter fuscus]KAB7648542.1 ABC transporter substrate-binding protein [Polymorphobacter fuscus]MQT16085.1 ABC transporter substrate-binding protein [Polymorphobacter fuscus]NJC07636.1 iron complex transport system substrate-binding protein [Polymorphobacter fuscus]